MLQIFKYNLKQLLHNRSELFWVCLLYTSVLKRALYFITCSGRMMYPTKLDEDYIVRNLVSDRTMVPKELRNQGYEQLTLSDILG